MDCGSLFTYSGFRISLVDGGFEINSDAVLDVGIAHRRMDGRKLLRMITFVKKNTITLLKAPMDRGPDVGHYFAPTILKNAKLICFSDIA